MKADEIVKLSHRSIFELLKGRQEPESSEAPGRERRRKPRWPFPGTVEIHVSGCAEPCFGSLRNLSETGLGMSCDRYFELESRVEIALHLPEASFCGQAIVRYCMETPRGYMTGIEFDFAPHARA
jgi:hypothetical protein